MLLSSALNNSVGASIFVVDSVIVAKFWTFLWYSVCNDILTFMDCDSLLLFFKYPSPSSLITVHNYLPQIPHQRPDVARTAALEFVRLQMPTWLLQQDHVTPGFE